MSLPCGCPTSPARTITDPALHTAWHQLVAAQGGPAGEVTARSLQAARGMRTAAPDMHAIQARNERLGKSTPGWRREAAR